MDLLKHPATTYALSTFFIILEFAYLVLILPLIKLKKLDSRYFLFLNKILIFLSLCFSIYFIYHTSFLYTFSIAIIKFYFTKEFLDFLIGIWIVGNLVMLHVLHLVVIYYVIIQKEIFNLLFRLLFLYFISYSFMTFYLLGQITHEVFFDVDYIFYASKSVLGWQDQRMKVLFLIYSSTVSVFVYFSSILAKLFLFNDEKDKKSNKNLILICLFFLFILLAKLLDVFYFSLKYS